MPKAEQMIIPEERVIKKIFVLRGEKVILDIHLAEFYAVETRALKQAVPEPSAVSHRFHVRTHR